MSKEGGNRYSLCAWGWMVPNTQRRTAAMTLHTGCAENNALKATEKFHRLPEDGSHMAK